MAKTRWHTPFRAVRDYARHAVFRLFRKVFETDDGKRIAANALKGLLPQAVNGLAESRNGFSHLPYPDLGIAATASPATVKAGRPIFITARFRSGSTLLWNLFRNLAGVTAYYEPLNERQWFDPARRGERVDGTHRGVTDYWREYAGLEMLGELYQTSWTSRHLLMDAGFWEPRLKRYVELLIERAKGRAVLQFNRVDFRLPWLRRHFPNARIVHLYRHPRDQWCSSLVGVGSFTKDGRPADFEPHDHFYLLTWVRDLRYHFPFLDESAVEHPYQLCYYLWKLSYLFGVKYADYSLAYESLVSKPEEELTRLFGALELSGAELARLRPLIDQTAGGKWRAYASDAWFRRHESACEAVLAEFLGTPPSDPPAKDFIC